MLDSTVNRRRFLGTAIKLATVPALAQALGLGSIGRAFAQAPASDQTLRLARDNYTTAFDTGREGGTPELHNLLFDGLTFYNWDTHVTAPVIATLLRRTPLTIDKLFALYDTITPEDMREMAARYFVDSHRSIVTLSPKEVAK